MFSYILRRIWQMVPTLVGVILLIFFLFKFFGGDPVEIMAGLKSSPERIASLRAQLGLDKPVWEQLWVFVQQIFTFNWGKSWTTNEAISTIFSTRLPATFQAPFPARSRTIWEPTDISYRKRNWLGISKASSTAKWPLRATVTS